MSEHLLLEEIYQDPHAATSWLILADYLEEQGDPRAEAVRAQARRGKNPQEITWSALSELAILFPPDRAPCPPWQEPHTGLFFYHTPPCRWFRRGSLSRRGRCLGGFWVSGRVQEAHLAVCGRVRTTPLKSVLDGWWSSQTLRTAARALATHNGYTWFFSAPQPAQLRYAENYLGWGPLVKKTAQGRRSYTRHLVGGPTIVPTAGFPS